MYAKWVHSQALLQFVSRLAAFTPLHARIFRSWADRVGLLLEPAFLPYYSWFQFHCPNPLFLQGVPNPYSVVHRGHGGGQSPSPCCMSSMPWECGIVYFLK